LTVIRKSESSAAFRVEAPLSDPFTDFMTGKLSERHAAQNRLIYRLVCIGIVALVALTLAYMLV
jgi:hypothetical protein